MTIKSGLCKCLINLHAQSQTNCKLYPLMQMVIGNMNPGCHKISIVAQIPGLAYRWIFTDTDVTNIDQILFFHTDRTVSTALQH